MKASPKFLTLLLGIVLASTLMTNKASAQQNDISYQVFYDQLSPYGQWMENPAYGYVWIPDAGSGFIPYSTAGHWIMTEYGWTWVSEYDWGWAPFHYGRWDYDDYMGWFWVPDTEWGPSWVIWRRAEGYYGWAPMQPGISINTYFGRDYNMQNEHWMFVRDGDFQRSNLNYYYANRSISERIIIHSTVINNTYIDNRRHTTYVSGPTSKDVQRNTGRSVNRVAVQEYNKPGQRLNNGHLQIYRPHVVKNSGNVRRPAPSRIVDKKDVKQHPGRNSSTQQRSTVPSRDNSNRKQEQQEKQRMQQQQQQQQQKIDHKQPEQQQQNQRKQQNQRYQQQDQQKEQQGLQKQQQDQQMQQQNQQRQQHNSVTPRGNKTSTQPAQRNKTKEAPKDREMNQTKNDKSKKPPREIINQKMH